MDDGVSSEVSSSVSVMTSTAAGVGSSGAMASLASTEAAGSSSFATVLSSAGTTAAVVSAKCSMAFDVSVDLVIPGSPRSLIEI